MKQGAVVLCSIVLIVAVAVFASASERLEHRAIVISNDYEFTPENGVCSGNGTLENPYLIQGWKIDAGYDDCGIRIHGTTRAFVIRDVEISGAKKSAIFLSYVRNARIEGCEFVANWIGVTLNFSRFIRVSDTVFETNTDAIHSFYSNENQFLDNTFVGNDTAIWLDASNENEVIGNLIDGSHMGVYLNLGSTENRIVLNAFVDNLHNARTDEPNYWNGIGEGNYWSNYRAIDADQDGVWDSPYKINSDGDQDAFPLVVHPLVPTPAPAQCAG
jgi:parallel beta-helix repeat protein